MDVVQHLRLEHEEAAVDPAAVAFWLLVERPDLRLLRAERHRPETARRLDRRQRGEDALLAVERDQLADVDVADAVAVREAEGFVADVFGHPLQSSAGHRCLAGVDERHRPRLDLVVAQLRHRLRPQVEPHVRHVQEVVGEEVLDDLALVAAADDEVVDPVRGVDLHDVPEDRLPADLDHRLRAHPALLGDARPVAAGKDYCLHVALPLRHFTSLSPPRTRTERF